MLCLHLIKLNSFTTIDRSPSHARCLRAPFLQSTDSEIRGPVVQPPPLLHCNLSEYPERNERIEASHF